MITKAFLLGGLLAALLVLGACAGEAAQPAASNAAVAGPSASDSTSGGDAPKTSASSTSTAADAALAASSGTSSGTAMPAMAASDATTKTEDKPKAAMAMPEPILLAQGGRIAVAKPDGTVERTLTDGIWAGAPVWSPDRSQVAYVAVYPPEARGTYVAEADGTGTPVKVSEYGLLETPPVWSPDGKQLAIREKAGNNQGIWVVNADGSGLARVYDKNIAEVTWSPDGLGIVYSYNERPTSGGVYAISAFGGGTPKLIAPLLRAGSLAYSPDGKHIAVRSQTAEGRRVLSTVKGTGQLHVIDVANGEITQIIAGLSGEPWRPAWANPQSVAVILEGEGGQAVAVVNRTGEAVSVLARGPQFQGLSWSQDGWLLQSLAVGPEGATPVRVMLQDIGMDWTMDMDMTRSMKPDSVQALMEGKMMPWDPGMMTAKQAAPQPAASPATGTAPATAPAPATGIRMARLAFDKYT